MFASRYGIKYVRACAMACDGMSGMPYHIATEDTQLELVELEL